MTTALGPRPATFATSGALALDYADRILLRAVRDVHGGVASRTYSVIDKAARHHTLPHRLHEGIAESVFASIAVGLRGGSAALHALDRLVAVGPALEDVPSGRFTLAALHGLIGDQLPDRAPGMVFDLAFRSAGRDVRLTHEGVAAAYPTATADLVVFVHGLCESETFWGTTYGDRLAAAGWTPVYVRANTGLPVAESGAALAAAMDELVGAWPVAVRRITLVGHSMGGLVVRAALEACGSGWAEKVSDVVTLGTPHLGSPVEQGIALGMKVFGQIPELAPYHRIFRHRSVGVLDLAEGMPEPPQRWPQVRYRLVAASLTASPNHPLARSLGDLLVTPASAFAQPATGPALFPRASTLHLPNAHHFDLLHDEGIAATMQDWLAEPLSGGATMPRRSRLQPPARGRERRTRGRGPRPS